MSTAFESKVVGRSLPFQRTTELGTKFPTTANWLSTESTNCSPAGAQLGDRKLMVGTRLPPLMTVKFIALEVPPSGAGLVCVAGDVPVEAMLAAGMAAINCRGVDERGGGHSPPPKLTIEDATKFVPLIVSANPAPPAAALFGEIVAIVGLGLGVGVGNGLAVEAVPPPHPARNTRLTIPETTSLLHRREGPEITAAITRSMTLE